MFFRSSNILSCFNGLVGVRQVTDANYLPYDPNLLNSSSGFYVDDHALFNPEVIRSICPEFQNMDLGATTEQEAFNNWMNQLFNDSKIQLLRKLYTIKSLNKKVKPVLQDVRLYNGVGNFNDVLANTGSFVGFEIQMKPHLGLSVAINKISLQLETAQNVPIYVFHSSQIEGTTENHSKTKNQSAEWVDSSISISYDEYEGSGRYFIGYFQDDLGTNRAINKKACYNGCDSYTKNWYKQYSRYISVRSFSVSSGDLNGRNYWGDVNKASYSDRSFGLNFSLSVECDLTDFFCRHKDILAEALQKQIQIRLLEQIGYSTRDTGISEKLKNQALYELDVKENPYGIKGHYLKILKQIDFDTSGFNSACIPCNSRGIKIGSI